MSDTPPSLDQTTELIFDNAIRYLTRSIASLENDEPEFAIVEFYTAIELILKARLSVEHWTLVVRDPDKADRASYTSGDCNTVGLQEAHNRLKKVAGDSVGESLYKVFDSLRQHRNRAVHFYHHAVVDEAARDAVAGEMCRAWHPLYSVVTGRWAEKFNNAIDSLQRADYDFRQIRKYLEFRYEQVREEVERKAAAGTQCSDCPACNFPTLLHAGDYKEFLAAYSCQVCMYGDLKLEVSCPSAECGGTVHIEYGGTGNCPLCSNSLTTLHAAKLIQPDQDRGGVHDPRAHCMRCEIPVDDGPTIARISDQYLCCNCFAHISKDEIDQCEHCGELQTDLPDASGLYGCNMCEGRNEG